MSHWLTVQIHYAIFVKHCSVVSNQGKKSALIIAVFWSHMLVLDLLKLVWKILQFPGTSNNTLASTHLIIVTERLVFVTTVLHFGTKKFVSSSRKSINEHFCV